jgi:hypothetical protein
MSDDRFVDLPFKFKSLCAISYVCYFLSNTLKCFQGGLKSGRRPVVKIIAKSLSQHDERHVVPNPLGMRVGKRKKLIEMFTVLWESAKNLTILVAETDKVVKTTITLSTSITLRKP